MLEIMPRVKYNETNIKAFVNGRLFK